MSIVLSYFIQHFVRLRGVISYEKEFIFYWAQSFKKKIQIIFVHRNENIFNVSSDLLDFKHKKYWKCEKHQSERQNDGTENII